MELVVSGKEAWVQGRSWTEGRAERWKRRAPELRCPLRREAGSARRPYPAEMAEVRFRGQLLIASDI